MSVVLGFDAGYGYPKLYDGKTVITFPHAIGAAHELQFRSEATGYGAGRPITVQYGREQRVFFVGEVAMGHARHDLTDMARFRDPWKVRAMLAEGLDRMGFREPVVDCLVSGLPPRWFEQDRSEHADGLKGTLRFRRGADAPWSTVEIADVRVVPQPYGSLFHEAFGEGGDPSIVGDGKRAAVLDIGRLTLGGLATDVTGAPAQYWSAQVGVWKLLEALRYNTMAKHHRELSVQQADDALRNSYVWVGAEREPLPIEGELVTLAEEVLSHTRTWWGNGLDFQTLIITGGGSYLLENHIRDEYPHATVARGEAEWANVRGYYIYGQEVLRKLGSSQVV